MFEAMYAGAEAGGAAPPWDHGGPRPQLVEWVEATGLTGGGREALVVGCGYGADAELLHEPSLYDEFLAYLSRQGYAIPQRLLDRDWSQPHTTDDELVDVFAGVYAAPAEHWGVYETCEELVDVEDAFQQWRFRHLQVVQRTIGHKVGTGGSSGVDFLRRALSLTFFPELYEVRTRIGQ